MTSTERSESTRGRSRPASAAIAVAATIAVCAACAGSTSPPLPPTVQLPIASPVASVPAVPIAGEHHGCAGTDDASKCDDDLQEGKACRKLPSTPSFDCNADHTAELVCDDGTVKIKRTCRGPGGCSMKGDLITCDDSIGEVGDPCEYVSSDTDYACNLDGTAEILCGAERRRFETYEACRGPRHCWVADSMVHCDKTVGREGEGCGPVDNYACAESGNVELKCSPQRVWVKERTCRVRCKVSRAEIFCE